jgi:phage shock protein C
MPLSNIGTTLASVRSWGTCPGTKGKKDQLTMTAEATPTNLVLRNDTILGVCEALGQDFGINPNWLRVAFCAPIYWNPMAVFGVYLALGLLVAATRYALPDQVAPAVPTVVEATATDIVETREPELMAA